METKSNSIQPQFPKFDGKNNFDYWRVRYGAIWYQDLWKVVEAGFEEPKDGEEVEQKLKMPRRMMWRQDAVYIYIYQSIDSLVFEMVANARTTKHAWDILVW